MGLGEMASSFKSPVRTRPFPLVVDLAWACQLSPSPGDLLITSLVIHPFNEMDIAMQSGTKNQRWLKSSSFGGDGLSHMKNLCGEKIQWVFAVEVDKALFLNVL